MKPLTIAFVLILVGSALGQKTRTFNVTNASKYFDIKISAAECDDSACTGETTFGEIIDDLASTFNAPRERIHADVTALLRGLADKRLLEL